MKCVYEYGAGGLVTVARRGHPTEHEPLHEPPNVELQSTQNQNAIAVRKQGT